MGGFCFFKKKKTGDLHQVFFEHLVVKEAVRLSKDSDEHQMSDLSLVFLSFLARRLCQTQPKIGTKHACLVTSRSAFHIYVLLFMVFWFRSNTKGTVDGQNPAPLESLMKKYPRAPLLILEAATWVERKKVECPKSCTTLQKHKGNIEHGGEGLVTNL